MHYNHWIITHIIDANNELKFIVLTQQSKSRQLMEQHPRAIQTQDRALAVSNAKHRITDPKPPQKQVENTHWALKNIKNNENSTYKILNFSHFFPVPFPKTRQDLAIWRIWRGGRGRSAAASD